MTALLYILLAIVVAVAIWQVTSILNFKSVIATEKDNNTQGILFAVFGVFFYGLMIFSFVKYSIILLPDSASVEGESYDTLYMVTMVLILVVQAITQFLLFYFAFKYRGIKDRKALFYADSHKLELIWTVVPAVVLAGLVLYGLSVWVDVMDPSDAENPLIVEVYAKQFSWEARYAGEDNELGLANVRNIKGINTMGVDMSDKNALDDIPVRELRLPKGRKVIFKFRSQDVLHSAYMPHFRAQMNCVPGMVTQFAFTPSLTTEEMRLNDKTIAKVDGINKIRAEKGEDTYEFDYLLLCNKICGSSHYNMQMKIIVEEEEDFNAWIKNQKTMAQVVQ
ncbi:MULTISPECIES: cytochrome c oxidase subunit II [Flavobacteriaceae]|uniref:cytochrome-c oxidase n=2 Tax=Flavobacteriaceae TaxID=49546 RepID=A0A4Y8APB2_9FLAO|nr:MULTISPECIES: cytochrome c oxidase subunit II [Flavobacteriaceae]TEW72448.1 cytochrome c oxidase subunit II [Gramella jeungdoensis]GGK55751.1 cytochrome c oxidase subunit II [Lutibacter litoralis]